MTFIHCLNSLSGLHTSQTTCQAVPLLASGGPAADCSSVKKRSREGEGPHSADQMTSLLQLMFSGTQTQG